MSIPVKEVGATASPSVAARPPKLITFFDGQNLFGCAKELYGYKTANYDPQLLSEHVAAKFGYDLVQVRFYTGVHTQAENAKGFAWWQAKLRRMQKRGIVTTQRTLAYTYEPITRSDGTTSRIAVPREKGIDLRIGLDMVRLAREQAYDALVVFSQDNDLGEATDEVKRIAQQQGRFIHVHSAFPCGKDAGHRGRRRGIERTNWIRITRVEYDACLEAVPEHGAAAAPAALGALPLTSFGAALHTALAKAAKKS